MPPVPSPATTLAVRAPTAASLALVSPLHAPPTDARSFNLLTSHPPCAHMTMTASPSEPRALPPPPDPELDALRELVSSTYLNHDPTTVHVRAGALFARLKALNRAANHATRAHKQATADARREMDQTYLSLQNLLYEKRHLEREIDKCRQFAYVRRVPSFFLSLPWRIYGAGRGEAGAYELYRV